MDLWSKFADWLKENPWWGALGFLVGLLGIIITVILFIKSRRTKEPTYAIRSTNLIQDFTSPFEALEIKYAGERISNFTATKVAFWNNGKDTINSGDIASADPLMIKVKDGYKILDSSVLHSKEVSNQFKIIPSKDGSNVLIQFDYLDKGEGGVLQLLHTGKSSNDVEVCGIVKRYGKPKRRSVPVLKKEALLLLFPPFLRKSMASFTWVMAVGVFIFPFLIIGALLLFVPELDKPSSMLTKVITAVIVLVIYWGSGFYILRRRIPKGFEIFEEDI